jgi:hypothetical protein
VILSTALLKIAEERKRSRWGRAVGTTLGAVGGAMAGPAAVDSLAAQAIAGANNAEGKSVPLWLAKTYVAGRNFAAPLASLSGNPDSEKIDALVKLYNVARVAAPAVLGAGAGYAAGSLVDR